MCFSGTACCEPARAEFPLGDPSLARRAVEIRSGLRVIYTTDGGLTDGMTSLFVEGGTFLPKPYNRQRLTDAVKHDGEVTARHPA